MSNIHLIYFADAVGNKADISTNNSDKHHWGSSRVPASVHDGQTHQASPPDELIVKPTWQFYEAEARNIDVHLIPKEAK